MVIINSQPILFPRVAVAKTNGYYRLISRTTMPENLIALKQNQLLRKKDVRLRLVILLSLVSRPVANSVFEELI